MTLGYYSTIYLLEHSPGATGPWPSALENMESMSQEYSASHLNSICTIQSYEGEMIAIYYKGVRFGKETLDDGK
jgi:hypothetical protein